MSSQRVSLASVVGNNGLMADGDWVESKDQDPNGDVRLIQLADVGDGEYVNKSNRFLTSEKASQLRCTFLKAGDVLVSRMADPIGRACIFPGDPKPCVAVVDVCVIRPDPSIANAEWLKYAINTPRFRAFVESRAVGATRPRISGKNLRAIELELPDMTEQRRIVDLLSRAEGIVRLRREAEKKAAELIPALFLDMFGDPATNPKGWAVATIGSLTSVQTGATPSRDNAAYYLEAEIPWVKTGEVGGGVILDTEEKISRAAVTETNCKVFPVGTVLVAMYGQGQTRGRCAVLGIPAASNQACAALLPSDKICTAYLFCFLKTQYEQLRGMAHGGNQANLNLSMIKGLPIILPPLADQQRFAERLESITSIQSQQSAATAKAQATFDALLANAFGGPA